MPRALIHPRKAAARASFFPHTLTVLRMVRATGAMEPVESLTDIACAYKPAMGGAPGMMQSEAEAHDQILMNGYYPNIDKKAQLLLSIGEQTKRLTVLDNIPDGTASKTLLVVSVDK